MSELNESCDASSQADGAAPPAGAGRCTKGATIRWPWREARQLVVESRARAMETVCRMNVEAFAEGGEQGRDEA